MAQSSDHNINIEKKPSQDSSNISYDCLKCKFHNHKTNSKLNTICQCLLNNTKSIESNEDTNHNSKGIKTPIKLLKKRSFFKTISSSFSSGHSSSIDSTTSQTKSLSETTVALNTPKEQQTNNSRRSKSSHKNSHLNHKSKSLVSVNWSNLDYDKDDFEEAFRYFDKNGDGCITAAELKLVLTELGFKFTKEEIKEMIAQLDKDGNGTIEYNEFVLMMTQPASKEADEYELREAFKCIDLDGNGFISRDELKKAVKKIMSTDKKLSAQDIDEMMFEADVDHNGLIDYDEFVRILVEKRN